MTWTSKYGSVVTSFYGSAGADGMNERGLVVNVLYLAEADYGDVSKRGKPTLSIGGYVQSVVDNFATVAEAVEAMGSDPFTIVAPLLPNGRPAAVHMAPPIRPATRRSSSTSTASPRTTSSWPSMPTGT